MRPARPRRSASIGPPLIRSWPAMAAGLSPASPTCRCSMRRLLLRHGVEPGLRQPELLTLTSEFDPPRIDGLPKAQGEIHRSGIGPTEEPLIDGPEHQDLICSRSTRFEHCQDAASRFLRR